MKRFFKFIQIAAVAFFLSISTFVFWASFHYVVPVMMYHSIEDIEGHRSDTVSPSIFVKHMSFLQKHGYNVISLDELVEGIKNKTEFARNTVVITFDDAYENNYTHGYPILKKYNHPATFFVPFTDVDREGFLSAKQIEEMIEAGFTVGSHTMTHKYLPDLSVEAQADEIKASRLKLQKKFDVLIDHFAYPNGGFTEETKRLVKEAGHTSAVTTNRGFDRKNKDVYEINRIKMSNKDTNDFLIFWKLTGYFTLLKTPRSPY